MYYKKYPLKYFCIYLVIAINVLLLIGCILQNQASKISNTITFSPPTPAIAKTLTQTKAPIIPTSNNSEIQRSITPSLTSIEGPWIIENDLGCTLAVKNIWTGEGWNFKNCSNFIRWDKNNCNLLVWDNFRNIDMVDLHGNIVQRIFSIDIFKTKEIKNLGRPMPSPDLEWIAYWTGEGKPTGQLNTSGIGPYAEFEHLFTMTVNGQKGPFKISRAGGAWFYDWSPDGSKLAYSDYDSSGIVQVFVSNRDSSLRKKWTGFTDKKNRISDIQWSPDGSNIAVEYNHDMGDNRTLITDGINNIQIEGFEAVDVLWWIDEDRVLLSVYIDKISSLAIFKVKTRNLVKLEGFPDGSSHYKPFQTKEKIGFFKDNLGGDLGNLTVYDINLRKFQNYPNIKIDPIDIGNWDVTPLNFNSLGRCK